MTSPEQDRPWPPQDLRDWFLQVTAEIDDTPARTRHLASRRRQLAHDLIQAVGIDEAARLVDTAPAVLAWLAAQSVPFVPGEWVRP